MKKRIGLRVNFRKSGSFVIKLNERAEAATSSYSATGNVLQCIYSVLMTMNRQKSHSSLVHKLPFKDIES